MKLEFISSFSLARNQTASEIYFPLFSNKINTYIRLMMLKLNSVWGLYLNHTSRKDTIILKTYLNSEQNFLSI